MKTKIPIFVEDDSKKIQDNLDSEDFNFLLEGDNLHSLHLLKKTHAGKIDVIYIVMCSVLKYCSLGILGIHLIG